MMCQRTHIGQKMPPFHTTQEKHSKTIYKDNVCKNEKQEYKVALALQLFQSTDSATKHFV